MNSGASSQESDDNKEKAAELPVLGLVRVGEQREDEGQNTSGGNESQVNVLSPRVTVEAVHNGRESAACNEYGNAAVVQTGEKLLYVETVGAEEMVCGA